VECKNLCVHFCKGEWLVSPKIEMNPKLGIIAGSGDLPVLLATCAIQHGKQPIIVSVTKTPSPKLSEIASEFQPVGDEAFFQFHVGQIKKIIKTFRDADVQEIALIGKVNKNVLLKPLWFDSTARKILAKARNKSDQSILKLIVEELESLGFTVIDQRKYLSSLLPKAGVLTKRQPKNNEWKDVNYGIDLARKIANLDIGQTVVVKNQMPLAIEAIEGTDETIRRGAFLGGKGVVVAKAAASQHDFRFDVPTVGCDTLSVMQKAGTKTLAVETERIFLVEPEKFVREADMMKISVVVV